ETARRSSGSTRGSSAATAARSTPSCSRRARRARPRSHSSWRPPYATAPEAHPLPPRSITVAAMEAADVRTARRAPEASDAPRSPEPIARGTRRSRLIGVAVAVAVVAGVALRFWTTSELWLDEALTVNIARLPLRDIPEALRHDGAPPLYYALSHMWMRVFGTGDVAVRALPGVLGVIAIPLAYLGGGGLRSAGREFDRRAAV